MTQYDVLIKTISKCETMEYSLRNIFVNTINKHFDDIFYKQNLLTNIKIAVGDELYNNWVEFYSN